ncbi:MAG TPA: DUF3805 domain-containing protein [Thermoplasmata archaeon]|nr:DUF3805 domain-containing protein [Thermoplasmata archaeon]
MTFRPDGTLAYVIWDEARHRSSFIVLTYRTEGDILVTDQPSAPREERGRFTFTHDGKLEIAGPDGTVRLVKVSQDSSISREETEFRKRLEASRPIREGAIAMAAATSTGLWEQVWGASGKIREFRVPSVYRTAYPSDWSQGFHDDGSPYFTGPRDNSGVLRISVMTLAKKGLLKRAPRAEEVIPEIGGKMPNARMVRLQDKEALYTESRNKGDDDFETHNWYIGKGAMVLTATYTIGKEIGVSPQGREDFQIATKILESIVFEQ